MNKRKKKKIMLKMKIVNLEIQIYPEVSHHCALSNHLSYF